MGIATRVVNRLRDLLDFRSIPDGSILTKSSGGLSSIAVGDVATLPIPQSGVTGLEAALSSKASIASVSSLQTTLTTQIGTKLDTSIFNSFAGSMTSALGDKADLVGGVVPLSQIPSIAITDRLGVADKESLVTLTDAELGDIAVANDGRVFILVQMPANSLSNWKELDRADAVTSVNGATGSVTITPGGIGAATTSSVLSGLAGKLNTNNPTFTGNMSSSVQSGPESFDTIVVSTDGVKASSGVFGAAVVITGYDISITDLAGTTTLLNINRDYTYYNVDGTTNVFFSSSGAGFSHGSPGGIYIGFNASGLIGDGSQITGLTQGQIPDLTDRKIVLSAGSSAERATYTPVDNELIIDKTLGSLWYGSANTSGGVPVKIAQANVTGLSTTLAGKMDSTDPRFNGVMRFDYSSSWGDYNFEFGLPEAGVPRLMLYSENNTGKAYETLAVAGQISVYNTTDNTGVTLDEYGIICSYWTLGYPDIKIDVDFLGYYQSDMGEPVCGFTNDGKIHGDGSQIINIAQANVSGLTTTLAGKAGVYQTPQIDGQQRYQEQLKGGAGIWKRAYGSTDAPSDAWVSTSFVGTNPWTGTVSTFGQLVFDDYGVWARWGTFITATGETGAQWHKVAVTDNPHFVGGSVDGSFEFLMTSAVTFNSSPTFYGGLYVSSGEAQFDGMASFNGTALFNSLASFNGGAEFNSVVTFYSPTGDITFDSIEGGFYGYMGDGKYMYLTHNGCYLWDETGVVVGGWKRSGSIVNLYGNGSNITGLLESQIPALTDRTIVLSAGTTTQRLSYTTMVNAEIVKDNDLVTLFIGDTNAPVGGIGVSKDRFIYVKADTTIGQEEANFVKLKAAYDKAKLLHPTAATPITVVLSAGTYKSPNNYEDACVIDTSYIYFQGEGDVDKGTTPIILSRVGSTNYGAFYYNYDAIAAAEYLKIKFTNIKFTSESEFATIFVTVDGMIPSKLIPVFEKCYVDCALIADDTGGYIPSYATFIDSFVSIQTDHFGIFKNCKPTSTPSKAKLMGTYLDSTIEISNLTMGGQFERCTINGASDQFSIYMASSKYSDCKIAIGEGSAWYKFGTGNPPEFNHCYIWIATYQEAPGGAWFVSGVSESYLDACIIDYGTGYAASTHGQHFGYGDGSNWYMNCRFKNESAYAVLYESEPYMLASKFFNCIMDTNKTLYKTAIDAAATGSMVKGCVTPNGQQITDKYATT